MHTDFFKILVNIISEVVIHKINHIIYHNVWLLYNNINNIRLNIISGVLIHKTYC